MRPGGKQRPLLVGTSLAEETADQLDDRTIAIEQMGLGFGFERADFGQGRHQAAFALPDARAQGDVQRDVFAQARLDRGLGECLFRLTLHQVERFLVDRDDQLFLAREVIGDAGCIQPDGARHLRQGRRLHTDFVYQDRRGMDDRLPPLCEALGFCTLACHGIPTSPASLITLPSL